MFDLLARRRSKLAPAGSQLTIDGQTVDVSFRRHPRARRLILRLDKTGNGVTVTLPPGASARAGLEFAAREARWIRQQLARQPKQSDVTDGSRIMVRGIEHRIVHRPDARGTVWVEAGVDMPVVVVAGGEAHVTRRLRDWLKRQARLDITAACERYSAEMDLKYTSIAIRDTRSRWGSCSARGQLSFSWRLVIAPPFVLDYVAAHEVAHLKEMNHGKAFWRLVERHCERMAEARKWLKANGSALHRTGL